uniref:Uncharacterized protein n=1 Tax=Arundo donax TaxID=35708 RepID=A0A0A9G1I4_ARUDO
MIQLQIATSGLIPFSHILLNSSTAALVLPSLVSAFMNVPKVNRSGLSLDSMISFQIL